jgi:hypothetical protein
MTLVVVPTLPKSRPRRWKRVSSSLEAKVAKLLGRIVRNLLQALVVTAFASPAEGVVGRLEKILLTRPGADVPRPHGEMWRVFHNDNIVSDDSSWILACLRTLGRFFAAFSAVDPADQCEPIGASHMKNFSGRRCFIVGFLTVSVHATTDCCYLSERVPVLIALAGFAPLFSRAFIANRSWCTHEHC